ncbi:MAG: hypothetical protein HDS68_04010 [Bacteroidales bacterium]|nr:hypothetical protein [Bacteroidales bacterium]
MIIDSDYGRVPLEAPAETTVARRRATIGLPKCVNRAEKRFPLTPEAVAALTRHGFRVLIEEGAAASIHYSDNAYVKAGARQASRHETLQADIVIHLAPLPVCDIRQLRRGALLLSLANFSRGNASEVIAELLRRRIINIAIDLIRDDSGNRPFGDIISEIDGRSAMTLAAAMLADPVNGKGILLGGIAGVIPCEVTIIGSCLAACSAARSALGLGAVVRMFDDDVYRLRTALRQLGGGVIGSSVHPHALENALRSADVVVITGKGEALPIDGNIDEILKRRVLMFDLSCNPATAFPGMRAVDLGEFGGDEARRTTSYALVNDVAYSGAQTRTRVCFTNSGSAVPRTTAMALSDTFITLLNHISDCEGNGVMLPLTPGLQAATLTFMGKAVNEEVARLAGVRFTDIHILLSLS